MTTRIKRRPGVLSRLSKTDLDAFEELLLDRRRSLRSLMETLGESTRQSGPLPKGESTLPIHQAELASDAFEQDLSLDRAQNASRQIREIDDALERMREGTYGVCEECRGNIPVERLRAIPHARLCIPCQTAQDQEIR